MTDTQLLQCWDWIRESRYMVFFGGAGVSTESQIPDFRSRDGIYRTVSRYGHPPEILLSHGFLRAHPDIFYDFYRQHMIYSDAVPNPAHRALARLEADGRLRAVVTQNIDGLHQAAGSRQVLELHGSVHRNYCMDCRQTFSLKEVMDSPGPVPHCDRCGGMVRPDVVLYGETLDPLVIEAAIGYIRSADLLLIAGTSLTVQPAAGLVSACRDGRMILVNRTPTPFDKEVGLVIRDPVGRVLAAVTDMLSLKNQGSKEPDGPAERL